MMMMVVSLRLELPARARLWSSVATTTTGLPEERSGVGGEIEGWTARLLPSRQFGYIVLTTSAGIMDHEEARRKNVGGKVLGFFY